MKSKDHFKQRAVLMPRFPHHNSTPPDFPEGKRYYRKLNELLTKKICIKNIVNTKYYVAPSQPTYIIIGLARSYDKGDPYPHIADIVIISNESLEEIVLWCNMVGLKRVPMWKLKLIKYWMSIKIVMNVDMIAAFKWFCKT